MQINYLNPIAEWITEIAAKTWNQFQSVFFGDLFAYFSELRLVAHHNAEMPHAVRLELLHFENREELMLTQFEECVTFALVELFKIKDIMVEGHRLFHIIHFD